MNLIVIGILFIVSFAVQYLLTYFQLNDFNRNYRRLRRIGRVVIGRKKGALRAGSIVMFAIDNNDKVVEGACLQGITIVARFKDFNCFNGLKVNTINRNDCKSIRLSKSVTNAVLDGVLNFKTVSRGEEIPMPESPFGKLAKKFKIN